MTPEEYRAKRMEYSTQIQSLNDQYSEVYKKQSDLIAILNAEFAKKHPTIWRLCFYFEDNGRITISHNGLFTSKEVAEQCLASIKDSPLFMGAHVSVCLVKTNPERTNYIYSFHPIDYKVDGTEWFYTSTHIDSNGMDLRTQEYYDLQNRLDKLRFHQCYIEQCTYALECCYRDYMRNKTFYALVDLDRENTLSYEYLQFSLAMPTPNETQHLIRVPGSKLDLEYNNIHTEVPARLLQKE